MHAPRVRSRGFTLLELLVVLLIIALLAGYVGPRLFGEVGKAKGQTAQAQLKALADAMDLYRLATGHFPSTEQGLKALVEKPADEPAWAGPYLVKGLPLDPWGRPYVYARPGKDGHDYSLLSYGADGKAGGTGEDADISYF
nr:type II secretion system major pseudopilin GspG [Niveibacterium umoris]